MHGYNQGSTLLVNAEVDSMGGVVDSGVGISQKTSPRRAAIEKAQTELRQEYDVREERRRELEFLEKGGNPLDFKFGTAASVSVQSTSHTDQHHEQFVTSEAKGSFALTASPHGDSVESSGRPGAPSVCEPNSADNLLLFDGENESLEGAKSSVHLSRKNTISPPEQSSQMEQNQNAKESEDSAIFRPYARRNRTRTNRDYSRGFSKDAKGSVPETNKQRGQNIPPISKLKPVSSNGNLASKGQASTKPTVMELDSGRPNDVSGSSVPNDKLHAMVSKSFKEEEQNLPSRDCIVPSDTDVACDHANDVEDREQVPLANLEHPHCAVTVKSEIVAGFSKPNGLGSLMDDMKGKLDSGKVSSAAVGTKGLDSESSCTRTSVGVDVNNDSDMCIDKENIVSSRDAAEQKPEKELNLISSEMLKERNENNTASSGVDDNNDQSSLCQNDSFSGGVVKSEDDLLVSTSVVKELKDPSDVKGIQQNEHLLPTSDKIDVILNEMPKSDVEQVTGKQQSLVETSNPAIPQTTTTERDVSAAHDSMSCAVDCLKSVDKVHEDSILEEARMIQAKRKRIAELSARTLPPQSCRRSHWDFVLEEMAWLANDFAQERLWKLSAAAQACHQAALASRQRLDRQTKYWKMKSLSHDIAKSVMQFWHRAQLLLDSDCTGLESRIVPAEGDREKRNVLIKSEDLDGQHSNKSVEGYAVRFVKYNRSLISSPQAEGPATLDGISGLYAEDLSWGEQLTEETLFYIVPATAMEFYRKSIESHFADEKFGTGAQEEVETSTHYAITEFGSEELYEDCEGEPSTRYMPGAFERNKFLKYAQKKQKATVKSYTPRVSEAGTDLAYGQCMVAAPQSTVIGKRPGSLHVGTIPTKRVRTAARQRVLTPFGSGITGAVHAQNKTDASSGETNSFQDDQSTLHGGSQMQKSVEVESAGEFEKHLSYDCAETSIKSKKKKKTKHLGSAYDQGWQMDCAVYNEQKDHSKRRLDSHYFESNGTSGLSPHHIAKKPKMMIKSVESTYDNVSPMTGSIPSPAASQMSDMPNQSRLIKLITGSGRDKGRKMKTLKMSAVQPGSGTPWSLFEDQALVVLVHDMGPNWELISDAMNSTLHFKCIFRKPKECKERHKTLMERGSGDGAESADDSGSSQSYPSTLPGIPKGSARQLFQRLQGPMEEDTLKSHFDKIIRLGQKQQLHKNQNGNQDPKQIVPAHSSHAVALSQVPNYVNGVVLTPLDLCDATASAPVIIPLGYQGTHGNGLSLPTSGVNSTIQGSPGMIMGNNSPSPGQLAASMRDSRYGISRASLPVDEQQRIQQYNQMLSSRNVQQSALSIPSSLSGSDRGVRMLPGGNGMGIMCGISRSMPVSRPGFQGMTSSSMLSSASMISTSMVGIASPVNMHSGAGPGQGNSIVRPRDALQVMRPGHNPENQRQMVPDLQMQVTQGNSQGVAAFNGLSSAFNNQTIPGTVQPFPGHGQQQQSHLGSPHHSHLQGSSNAANSQQQAYAIRLAKERQLQQRYLQQQQHQHQFAASSALMPPVQSQSQLPVSSSLQNSSPIQSQGSPQPMSPLAVTPSSPLSSISSQHMQKHHLPQHGISRTPATSGLSNQAVKQRQRQAQQQQFQQGSRQHPNQRQHAQPQQHAKLLKGIGRGTMAVHQNIPVDPSHLNGTSITQGSQTGDKGDQIAQIMQGQSLYSGSGLNSSQPSKTFVPQPSNHSQLQQRVRSPPATTSLKQVQQPVASDSCNPGQVPQVPLGHVLPASPPAVPSAVTSNHQLLQVQPQSQSLQTRENQNQLSGQRMLNQSRLVQSESPNISQAGPSQVEQQPVSVGSTAPVVRMNMANTVSNNSTVPQLKASELSHETNTQNPTAKVGLLGGSVVPPVQHSAGKEPSPPINHGLGPRQLSGSLPSHGHNTGAQRHQQLPLALQSSSVHHLSQQSFQTSEQQDQQQELDQNSPKLITLQHQPLQQLQAAQNNSYTGPPNSEVE